MKYNVSYLSLFALLSISICSCKKFIEIDPAVTKVEASVVYNTQALATGALNSLYYQLAGNSLAAGNGSIEVIAGLTADEFTAYPNSGTNLLQAYQNSLTGLAGTASIWYPLYNSIYRTNAAIEGLNSSTGLSDSAKKQLLGEAKCMRAFYYFYLVTLFGDVPLLTSTDFAKNAIAPRAKVEAVYDQIISDLKDAQDLLSENYLSLDLKTISTERIRPTKWFAKALLARTYLFKRDFANSTNEATAVISNTLFDTASVNNVFLKSSKEVIFQLQTISTTFSTQDATTYTLLGVPSANQPVTISKRLLSAFQSDDKRRMNWIKTNVYAPDTFYSPNKYKQISSTVASEYSVVFRLSELYLIRAEARVKQNDIPGSLQDLNIIRKRAGLSTLVVNDPNMLMDSIQVERQRELFSEWGHRWLDLNRTNKADSIMLIVAPLKGGTWNSDWKLYPIPTNEISANLNLSQNKGYQ